MAKKQKQNESKSREQMRYLKHAREKETVPHDSYNLNKVAIYGFRYVQLLNGPYSVLKFP